MLTFLPVRSIGSYSNNESYCWDRDGVSLNSVHLCPAVVEGIVGLHAGQPLNAVKAAQGVHLPAVSGHLVSPAPGFQRLHLDPFIQGAVVLPHLVLGVFPSCNNTSWSENSDFLIKCRKELKIKDTRRKLS